jgi:hypothetical protein
VNSSVQEVISLGVEVIPIVPGTKRPFLKEWQLQSSCHPDVIERWEKEFPGCGWAACASASTIFILDDDSEAYMPEIYPDTFTVLSSPGHRQYYFKQTDASREMGALTQPETGGRFSIRFNNQYGIFAGTHPDGHQYEIVDHSPITEAPNALIAYLRSFVPAKKPTVQPGEVFEFAEAGASVITPALLHKFFEHYSIAFEYAAGYKWYIPCPWQEKHTKQSPRSATAIILTNGAAIFKCQHSSCQDRHWQQFRSEVESKRAALPKFNFFYKAPVIEASASVDAPTTPLPIYPCEAWDGTLYAEYADACAVGNYVDRSFHLEAIKTVTGAILGAGLKGTPQGALPNFYTVLIARPQAGKGTAINWARAFYKNYKTAENFGALLWNHGDDFEIPVNVGALLSAYASPEGMQEDSKTQPRWLQIFEEISSLFSKTGMEGNGQLLIAALRQLFDSNEFTVTVTSKRKGGGGRAQNSILGGTTKELWDGMFKGAQIQGAGTVDRFCLCVHPEELRSVATLMEPAYKDVQAKLVSKILALETAPQVLSVTPEAVEYLEIWWKSVPFTDERGRLNIMAWRNALHLAWLRDHSVIELEDVKRATALSDYQYKIRVLYRPLLATNEMGMMQERMKLKMREKGKMTRRALLKGLHNSGTPIFDGALTGLINHGFICGVQGERNDSWILTWTGEAND